MSRYPGKAMELLCRARKVAAGVLMGSAFVTPVFAATTDVIDNLTLPILLGSIMLLVIGLVLKTKRGKAERTTQPVSQSFSEGIGRYRLQLGRGDAD